MNQIFVLRNGYSYIDESGNFKANCTIILIKSINKTIIVDTGLPCDKDFIIEELKKKNISLEDVDVVIGTHGHCDHIGNLNLFKDNTLIIVGFDIFREDSFICNNLSKGEHFILNETIKIIPTPGHTSADITILVQNTELGKVAIAGDLFENEDDLKDEFLWKNQSFDVEEQLKHRQLILNLADYIIPGHGKMFKVLKTE